MTAHKTATQAISAQRPSAGRYYLELFRASPLERVGLIKRGIRATEAKRIMADLAMGQGVTLKALKLSPATVNKKAKQDQSLSPEETERVIGIAKLVGQIESMIQESGDPERFDAAGWLSRWLRDPLAAFGGERPIDLMDTMEGQAMVATALAQLQTGAYA